MISPPVRVKLIVILLSWTINIYCLEGASAGLASQETDEYADASGKEELALDDITSSVKRPEAPNDIRGAILSQNINIIPKNRRSAKTSGEGTVQKKVTKLSTSEKAQAPKREVLKAKKVFKLEVGLVEVYTPTSYGVLTVGDCVKIAAKNHIPLQIAEKSMALAKMRVWEARRNMLPTITFAYEESSGRVNDRAYIGRRQYVEAQQPIYHGGELYYTLKQADLNLEVIRNDYARIKNELSLQVKKAYYSLAKAKENMKIQRDLGESVEKISESVAKQFEAGLIPKLEFLNVTSQGSQVKYQFVSAEGDAEVAALILKQAMNLDPKDALDIDPNLEFKKVVIDYDKALNAAFLNRPEMRMNSLMIEYYNIGKKIARAKGLAKVDFMAQWGLSKEEYAPEDLGTDDDRKLEQQWYAGFKASLPFWGSTGEYAWTKEQWQPVVSSFRGTEAVTSSYKVKILDKLDYFSENKLADIDFYRAKQELNKIKQEITLELKENYFNYEKALMQLETAKSKMKYQTDDLEFSRLKREMDESQDSATIESMIRLAQEKFGYLQALADCHTALATINKAVGIEEYFKDEAGSVDDKK